MSALQRFEFEGRPLVVIERLPDGTDGPWFIAPQLGAALGYAKGGSRVVDNLVGAWAGEFIEGKDHRNLAGDDLRALQRMLVGVSTDPVLSPNAPNITLLSESGVHLVLMLSRSKHSTRFRRWLVDVVLPAYRRVGGFYTAAPPPPAADLDLRRLAVREQEARLKTANTLQRLSRELRCSTPADRPITLGALAALGVDVDRLPLPQPELPLGGRSK